MPARHRQDDRNGHGEAFRRAGQGRGDTDLQTGPRSHAVPVDRGADSAHGDPPDLEPIADELSLLADEILSLLESHVKQSNLSANESHSERHKQNSNPDTLPDFEPDLREGRVAAASQTTNHQGSRTETENEGPFRYGWFSTPVPTSSTTPRAEFPTGATSLATANVVRPLIGVSPSAWEEAQTAMGEGLRCNRPCLHPAEGTAINSAGGYLRELSRKSQAGGFSIGPMLMALIGSRNGGKKLA